MNLINSLLERAKENKKNIVLPESNDIRVVKAANKVVEEKIANIILIGKKENINKLCFENNINLNPGIEVIDNESAEDFEEISEALYSLRKHKDLTLKKAKELLKNKIYYATMLVYRNKADGMVLGASHSTTDSLRPVLQIIKPKEKDKKASSFFLMETSKKELGEDGIFLFADCGLIEDPNEKELYDIVKDSAKSFKDLIGKRAKVAMLSYSTKGSAVSDSLMKVVNVTNKLKSEDKDFDIDGELQVDSAIIKEVADVKAPNSSVAGQANVLIFPDLQSGNIGYKLVQRFGDAIALGPIMQGMSKPVNDLSRGCSVEDIVGAIAITCIQAQNN